MVSAPSELIKCRAQLCVGGQTSSFTIAKTVLKNDGLKGLYFGGVVTSLRDSIGYGFYFWSYELTKRLLLSRQHDPFLKASTVDVLVSGGIAGVITWASIYPLDVIKTRLQAQEAGAAHANASRPLLDSSPRRKGAMQIAKEIFRTEGPSAFYRGLGICSARAFVVNAVQVSSCPSSAQFCVWLTLHSGTPMRRSWLSFHLWLVRHPSPDEPSQATRVCTLHRA